VGHGVKILTKIGNRGIGDKGNSGNRGNIGNWEIRE